MVCARSIPRPSYTCMQHAFEKYIGKVHGIFGGQSGIHACMSLLIRLICFIDISVSVAAGQMYIYLLGDKSLVRIYHTCSTDTTGDEMVAKF
jgi:hypothetical protein